MERRISLSGLDRLIDICRKNDLPVDCAPPQRPPIVSGESFLGQPFDPVLAAVYARTDGAVLGDLQIYPFVDPENTILRINRGMRRFEEGPYMSSLLFGQIPLLAYYLATVPSLADAGGVQPVIFINGYEGDQVLPVASNVDEFSIYLEQVVRTPEYVSERHVSLHFPMSVPGLIARDLQLVAALSSGRFDTLMRNDEEGLQWTSRVIAAVR
jgi:hypothetical protein